MTFGPTLTCTLTLDETGSPTDEDITAYLREASGLVISRGSSSLFTGGFVANAGTCQLVLDNLDARFDPNNTAGPYYPFLVPGAPFGVVATWDAVDYSLFAGQVEAWPQAYPNVGKDQTVALKASDFIAMFSQMQVYEPDLPAEVSGYRISDLFDSLVYAVVPPSSFATGSTIICELLTNQVNAWSLMSDVTKAEYGDLYVANDGTFTFRGFAELVTDTRSSVSQATYSDVAGGGAFVYADRSSANPDLINDCTITYGNDGYQVNAQDSTSINSPWCVKSLVMTLPFEEPSAALSFAGWMVAQYKDPHVVWFTVTFTADHNVADSLFPEILVRELGDLVTVTGTPIGGTTLTHDCWIRGIQHKYAEGVWQSTTFWLQDASWIEGIFLWDISTWDGPDVFGP